MKVLNNKRGQALLELAVFGALILILFGYLLSYMQRLNDQQYVQMDTFRNALQMANYGAGDNKGSAIHFTKLENKRNVDLSGYYRKGAPQTNSASASVYWGVPESGTQVSTQSYYKINEDLSPDLSEGESVDDVASVSSTSFEESVIKQETPQSIKNIRVSSLRDTITTTLVDKNDNALWTVKQNLYRDANGDYKYSKTASEAPVVRSRTWETPF